MVGEQLIDARLKTALSVAKRIKTDRKRVWETIRNRAPRPAFILTGYPTTGHRKDWFEREAGRLVFQVFKELDAKNCYDELSSEFVTDRFVLTTRDCWAESGFLVTITEIPGPHQPRLLKGTVRVRVVTKMVDQTKPFAAYWVALHKSVAEEYSLGTREFRTLQLSMERIQAAIMKEVDALATTKISVISMPVLYEEREVAAKTYLNPTGEKARVLYRLPFFTEIRGMPNDPLPCIPEINDDRHPYFLPLEDIQMKPDRWSINLWKHIE